MNKAVLCEEIGNFFGRYFEEAGKFCIDNGDEIFRYETQDDLLKDWVDTLYQHTISVGKNDDGYWMDEDAITYIYTEIIGKCPGVSRVPGVKGDSWRCYVDVPDGTPHGRNLHLGTYSSIVDAIFAREKFLQALEQEKEHKTPVETLVSMAKEVAKAAKEAEKRKRAPKCPHCGKPLVCS